MADTKLLDKLIERRNKCLGEIHHSHELTSNQEYMEEYNTVMDQIETLQISHRKDPLEALPKELWEEIVYGVISISNTPSTWSINHLIDLTNISKRWLVAIISTPGFWTNIKIDSTLEDLDAKVALCLSLSGLSLLELSIRLPCPAWDQVNPLIATESFRIRSILLQHADQSPSFAMRPTAEMQDGVDAILCTLVDLSSLETFDSDMWGHCIPHVDDLFRQTTSIRSLNGVKLSDGILQLDSMKGIRKLTTTGSVTEIFPSLPSLTSLENVIFFFPPTYEQEGFGNGVFNVSSGLNLQWKSFECYQIIEKGVDALFESFSATIEKIHISINWKMLSNFFTVSHQMKGLREFGLSLTSNDEGGLDLTTDLPITQIRRLVIYLRTSWIDRPQPIRDEPKDQQLFDRFAVWAPLVEDLVVSTFNRPGPVISYAQTLRRLRKFDILSWNQMEGSPEETRFPSVEEVCLHGSASLFSLGWYPAASHLTFDQNYASDTIHLEPGRWNGLRVMIVESQSIDWTDISLPYLRKLIYGNPHESSRRTTSSFYAELAMRPTAFPSLNYVGTQDFPSWDILLIMLERRNFLADGDVSPIATVAFPGLPSQVVLKPLTQCLRGRFPTNRASNFNLSINSIKDIYFDPDVTGCRRCHIGFLHCKVDNGLGYRHRETIQPSLLPYPETTNEILTTWVERETAWDSSESLFTRIRSCGRYQEKNLTEITGFTKSVNIFNDTTA